MRSPSTFTAVRHLSRNQSSAKSVPTSAACSPRPAASSTASIVTNPADGIAAAPTAATALVSATTTVAPKLSRTPCNCAMNSTVNDSYNAVPFMFTAAPNGSAKSATLADVPASLAHRRVVGSAAEELSVANAASIAGAPARRTSDAVATGDTPAPPPVDALRPSRSRARHREGVHGGERDSSVQGESRQHRGDVLSQRRRRVRGSHDDATRAATSEKTPSGVAATAHAVARSTTALHASTSFAAGSTASRVDGSGRDGGEGGAEREGGGDDAEDVPVGGGGGDVRGDRGPRDVQDGFGTRRGRRGRGSGGGLAGVERDADARADDVHDGEADGGGDESGDGVGAEEASGDAFRAGTTREGRDAGHHGDGDEGDHERAERAHEELAGETDELDRAGSRVGGARDESGRHAERHSDDRPEQERLLRQHRGEDPTPARAVASGWPRDIGGRRRQERGVVPVFIRASGLELHLAKHRGAPTSVAVSDATIDVVAPVCITRAPIPACAVFSSPRPTRLAKSRKRKLTAAAADAHTG